MSRSLGIDNEAEDYGMCTRLWFVDKCLIETNLIQSAYYRKLR